MPERTLTKLTAPALKAIGTTLYRAPWPHGATGGSQYIVHHLQEVAHSFSPISLAPIAMRRLEAKQKLAPRYGVKPLWLTLSVNDLRGVCGTPVASTSPAAACRLRRSSVSSCANPVAQSFGRTASWLCATSDPSERQQRCRSRSVMTPQFSHDNSCAMRLFQNDAQLADALRILSEAGLIDIVVAGTMTASHSYRLSAAITKPGAGRPRPGHGGSRR